MVRLNEDDTQADSCLICRYRESADGFYGECRRNPPGAGRFIPTGDSRLEWAGSVFPRTAEFDWCGEFARAALKEEM